MGNRLSKIATRTGDNGTTGLGDGSRTDKDSVRVHAMGDVDELNSNLGLLLCEAMPDALREELITIQHDLFDLGGELCIPGYQMITETHVARLDDLLAKYNADLPALTEFILPAGSRAAALATSAAPCAAAPSAASSPWARPRPSTTCRASTSTACRT